MDDRREQFAKEIFGYVSNICQNRLSDNKTGDRVLDVLGFNKEDLRVILKKITIALPDYIFLRGLPDIYHEVLEYLSKEYILFQCQEDTKRPDFANNLANFIYEVSNTINQNYNYQGR
jgi:hypothetical protein